VRSIRAGSGRSGHLRTFVGGRMDTWINLPIDAEMTRDGLEYP
jgi:hypothetical protein